MALTARMVTMDYAGPAGEGIPSGLQRVGEPKYGKNRVHMYWETAFRVAEETRRMQWTPPGAGSAAEHEVGGSVWTILTGPEGGEFRVADRD